MARVVRPIEQREKVILPFSGQKLDREVIMSAALIELRNMLTKTDTDLVDADLVNTVHDEVIVECDLKYVDTVKKLVEMSMVKGMLRVFPKANTKGLTVAKICECWGDGK